MFMHDDIVTITRKNWQLRRHFCSLRLPSSQERNPYKGGTKKK